MSDRKIAKNRWHKGISTYVRVTLRNVGLAMDEEATQFALGGSMALSGQAEEFVREVCNDALNDRRRLMDLWRAEHPDANPFPPSFPERCLKIVREAMAECYNDDGNPAVQLERLRLMCEKELELDPLTSEPPEE